MSFSSGPGQIDLLLRCVPRVLELLVEAGHLSVDWSAAQPGDFQPRSYGDLALLGTALLLAADGQPDALREERHVFETWVTDALVTRGREVMQRTKRAPSAAELQDIGVSQDEVAQASPRRSRSRLSTRITHELRTTFRALYEACVVQASEEAATILSAEWHQQRAQGPNRHEQAG